MDLHARVHSGYKKFECPKCSYATNRKIYLAKHLSLHDEDRTFPCSVCLYKASRLKAFGVKEEENTDFKDMFHDSDYDESDDISYGVDEFCKTLTDSVKNITNDESVRINEDCLASSFDGTAENDVFSFSDLPPCTCYFSETKYREKLTQRKVKVYSEDRPYPCSQCSYRAAKKSLLDKHSKVHTGERPFPCPLCKYRASRKAHLLRHMRTHQKELD